MTTANKRIAIVPKGLRYQKVTQIRVSSGRWLPKFGGMASASREKAFRHVWSKRGDRRLGFFQFRITRDDGTVMDYLSLSYPPYDDGIAIYDSNKKWIGLACGYSDAYSEFWTKEGDTWYYDGPRFAGDEKTVQWSYNTITQVWTVPFFSWLSPKGNKKDYWVRFSGKEDTVVSWYAKPSGSHLEYTYKDADRYQTENLMKPAFYEIAIPYYKETYWETPFTPDPDLLPLGCADHFPDSCYSADFTQKVTVESSIQYAINFWADCRFRGIFWGLWHYYCGNISCADCISEATEGWYYSESGEHVWVPEYVKLSTSNGVVSNNVYTNPIDSEQIVTPTPYTVEEQIFTMDLDWTYPGGGYTLERPCIGGESPVEFDLDFGTVVGNFSLKASPNT